MELVHEKSPLYRDRKEAGKVLAHALAPYRQKKETLVVGLARGGVVVAYEIAKALNLPLKALSPRKIGAPFQPELALGSVTADGELWLNEPLIHLLEVSQEALQKEVQKELLLAQERFNAYEAVAPLGDLKGKTLILVDDGIATGATFFSEIKSLKNKCVSSIIIAAPVASAKAWRLLLPLVDQAFCPCISDSLRSISEYYENFLPVEDKTVLSLLKTSS